MQCRLLSENDPYEIMLFPIHCSLSRPLYMMIDMRFHELPDWTETVRNEPILSETDIDNINATKLIMCHDIVACEEFYVHNNIVIYCTRRVIAPCIHVFIIHHATGFLTTEELLHPAYMYSSCNRISYSTDLCYISRRHKNVLVLIELLKCNRLLFHVVTKYLL